MNELVWSLPLTASVMWTCRPRPPIRRPGDAAHRTRPSPGSASHRPTFRSPFRRDAPATLALAHWCEGVARAVRGGDTLRTAIEHTEPDDTASDAVIVVRRAVEHRRIPSDTESTRPIDDPDTALVVTVAVACADHGGPAAEPFDRAAGVLRARAAERDERRVQSAQARLSAGVLTWLPVAMLLVLLVSSASVRSSVATPFGMLTVGAGLVLNVIGWWWMRRTVDRAAR